METLIEKCRTLVSHANKSTAFYKEFYEQQKLFNINTEKSLKRDVDTRYVMWQSSSPVSWLDTLPLKEVMNGSPLTLIIALIVPKKCPLY